MTYLIAEAGYAHEGSLDNALEMLTWARKAGFDAFKIQYNKVGRMGRYRELPMLGPIPLQKLADWCMHLDLDFIVTPHDMWALESLEDMDVCTYYKVGSGDWHLLEAVQDTSKPAIISTGMKTEKEMEHLHLRPADRVMHCVSAYPCPPEGANLPYMNILRSMFPLNDVGYSDHCPGLGVAVAAVALGADLLEKHITMERDVPLKQDTFCSLVGEEEMVMAVQTLRQVASAVIPRKKELTIGEMETKAWVYKVDS